MRAYRLMLLVPLLAIAACQSPTSENAINDTDYSTILNKEFTGELAYETTAYVEKYWRVVGNSGFDSSIYEIARNLEQQGYVLEDKGNEQNRLTYRIEKRPLENHTWEPVDAQVMVEGEEDLLLQFETNRNMLAINSHSTPEEGVSAEVVYVEEISTINDIDVNGKIVFAETHPYRIYKSAVVDGGAIGIMVYNNPGYLQPEKNTTSIQFSRIPQNMEQKAWAIVLSYAAKERLKANLSQGKVIVNVNIETKIYKSEELTVVAEVRGSDKPDERLVFSAHVQEPGANDNATGVGVALEMASVTARLVNDGKLSPKRTLTFLWGDEIVSTNRYVKEDSIRATNIKWGISLDMVGENTAVTGGSFLIEKMPDPSAIWTRGNDEHTEWGGRKMTLEEMKPHYLNDFVINRFMEQGARANWKVKDNPFEGGSDHVPFLRADIPGVLFWHFTDQFYHTDNDRLDKVSKTTLKNVGTAALISAYTLINSDEATAKSIIDEIKEAGIARLKEELKQSQIAIENGATNQSQREIIKAWEDWYVSALDSCNDMVDDAALLKEEIESAQKHITATSTHVIQTLKTD